MKIRELHKLCKQKLDYREREVIQEYMKQLRKRRKTLLFIRITLMLIAVIAITVLMMLFMGKYDIELIYNLVPLYIIFAIASSIMAMVSLFKTNKVSKEVDKALQAEDDIKMTENEFRLQEIETKKIYTGNNAIIKKYYNLYSGLTTISIDKVQNNVFFDDMIVGFYYKIYSVKKKYMLFVKTDRKG